MKRLIVNADDLGIARGVNRAIFGLFAARAVTSSTLMANAAETAGAIKALQAQATETAATTPAIGCHVVLVDGSPLLTASDITTLTARASDCLHGTPFRSTLGSFVYDLSLGRIREADIEAEAVAQIRHLQNAGVKVTHLDTHKHIHMFPRVLRPLLRAALICGVPAIRNPFEPSWSVAACRGATLVRRTQVTMLRAQRAYFLEATRHSGLATTDGAIGVAITGSLNADALRSMILAMPQGTWELVCHPGYRDQQLDAAGTRLLNSRDTERDALLEVVPAVTARDPDIALIDFGDVAAS